MRRTGYIYHYLDARLDIERPEDVQVLTQGRDLEVIVNGETCLRITSSRTPIGFREYD